MKERQPYILAKPYSGRYLERLLELVEDGKLSPKKIYTMQDWGKVARKLYKRTSEKNGPEFKVGLEGHIKLVNHFFGNRAAVLLLESSGGPKQNLNTTLRATQEVKRQLRSELLAGENLEDIVVFMNLDRVGISSNEEGAMPSPTGVIGVQEKNDGTFTAISQTEGSWDYYYFKYLHTPDNIEELHEELDILHEMGVLHPENEVSVEDFLVMTKLNTLIPPKEFKKLL